MHNAQERYATPLQTRRLPDGRVVYTTARLKTIAPMIADPVITVDERDRMDIMAMNVYGSQLDWWRIAAANQGFYASLHFTPGNQISIPRKK